MRASPCFGRDWRQLTLGSQYPTPREGTLRRHATPEQRRATKIDLSRFCATLALSDWREIPEDALPPWADAAPHRAMLTRRAPAITRVIFPSVSDGGSTKETQGSSK